MEFFDKFCKNQKFSSASTGCVELCITRTEIDGPLFEAPVTQHDSLYIAMIACDTLARSRVFLFYLNHCDQQIQSFLIELARVVRDEDRCCVYL